MGNREVQFRALLDAGAKPDLADRMSNGSLAPCRGQNQRLRAGALNQVEQELGGLNTTTP
jgi:hypothetical protein